MRTLAMSHPKNGHTIHVQVTPNGDIVSVTYEDGEEVDLTLNAITSQIQSNIRDGNYLQS